MVPKIIRKHAKLDAKKNNWNIHDAIKERGNIIHVRDDTEAKKY